MSDGVSPSGIVTAIFIAPARHAEQIAIESVHLKAGKGIVGDRYYGLRQKQRGRNLTLIETEAIEEFNQRYGFIVQDGVRRNFLTEGIRLNELVNRTFRVGEVLCKGIELCEPCGVLARNIQQNRLSQKEIIKAFTNKGGLRAEVLSSGIVHLGDRCCTMADS